MSKYGRKLCKKCKIIFCPVYQEEECHSCITDKLKIELLNKARIGKKCICSNCGKEFFSGDNQYRKYCSYSCRSHSDVGLPKKNTMVTEKEKIRIQNEKWLNKENKRRKGKSLEQLNKEYEYKRVFDDEGWNHYLKGRKYDKI